MKNTLFKICSGIYYKFKDRKAITNWTDLFLFMFLCVNTILFLVTLVSSPSTYTLITFTLSTITFYVMFGDVVKKAFGDT